MVVGAASTRFTRSAIAAMWSGPGAAAPADDVHPALVGEVAHHLRHVGGAEVELAHLVRQARVRVAADRHVRDALQLFQVGPHDTSGPSAQFMPTESIGKCEIAFQNASTDWPETNVPPPLSNVPDTITGTRTPRSSKHALKGEQTRLQVERVDDRFSQQDVDARLDHRLGLLVVRVDHRVEHHVAVAGVLDARRDRHLLAEVGPIDPAQNRGLIRVVCSVNSAHACFARADRGRVDLAAERRAGRGPPRSNSKSSIPTGLAPNVLVSMMSDPRRRGRRRWISRIASGFVTQSRSPKFFRSLWCSAKRSPRTSASPMPRAWICVPVAPSSRRTRSDSSDCGAVSVLSSARRVGISSIRGASARREFRWKGK